MNNDTSITGKFLLTLSFPAIPRNRKSAPEMTEKEAHEKIIDWFQNDLKKFFKF